MILVALILILFKITAATALVQLVREKESNIVMIQSELYTPCCYRDQSKAVCQKGCRCKCLWLWMCLSDQCNIYGSKGKKGEEFIVKLDGRELALLVHPPSCEPVACHHPQQRASCRRSHRRCCRSGGPHCRCRRSG